MYPVFEKKLQEMAIEFTANSTYTNILCFTINGVRGAFKSDIKNDLFYIQMSIMIVGSYTVIFLGACSPVHCRATTAGLGLACVVMSYLSGSAVMFFLGGEVAGVHNLLPFLLIGIGVDDMFVIANAIDQVPFSNTADERLIEGIKHAGPSITITSFTNVLAFFFGSTTSLIALSSFCAFACSCVMMLYITVLIIFVPFMAWDTRRI